MSGKKAIVYIALAANIGIAVAKFVAFAFTGSSAILAEGLHSTADSGNEIMLLLGRRMSKKPEDRLHPFGHGKELYFWTLVIAFSIFVLGGMASVVEGIVHMVHPEPLNSPTWSYVTLGVAAIFEGTALFFSYRQLRKDKQKGETLLDAVQNAKDPTAFLVTFEDAAALLGIAAAFCGVFFSHLLNKPSLDGAGAVGVGVILMTVAVGLVYEVRKLLIGERADPNLLKEVKQVAESDPAVVRVAEIKSMHFGPETVMVAVRAQFRPEMPARELAGAIEKMESEIRGRHQEVKYIYVEPSLEENGGGLQER